MREKLHVTAPVGVTLDTGISLDRSPPWAGLPGGLLCRRIRAAGRSAVCSRPARRPRRGRPRGRAGNGSIDWQTSSHSERSWGDRAEVGLMPEPGRAELIAELSHQLRVNTMWTVLLHHAVAGRSGINVTDMQCLNLLQLRGPMTPGQLADAMFLTTGGAITAVVDRLERAGMVRRRRDEQDRRRVLVEAVTDGPVAEIGRRFEPVAEMYAQELDGYDDDELRLLLHYLTRNNELSPEVIERVKKLG